jgi:predicted Fe-S protein YdhL (DUF1289 family)
MMNLTLQNPHRITGGEAGVGTPVVATVQTLGEQKPRSVRKGLLSENNHMNTINEVSDEEEPQNVAPKAAKRSGVVRKVTYNHKSRGQYKQQEEFIPMNIGLQTYIPMADREQHDIMLDDRASKIEKFISIIPEFNTEWISLLKGFMETLPMPVLTDNTCDLCSEFVNLCRNPEYMDWEETKTNRPTYNDNGIRRRRRPTFGEYLPRGLRVANNKKQHALNGNILPTNEPLLVPRADKGNMCYTCRHYLVRCKCPSVERIPVNSSSVCTSCQRYFNECQCWKKRPLTQQERVFENQRANSMRAEVANNGAANKNSISNTSPVSSVGTGGAGENRSSKNTGPTPKGRHATAVKGKRQVPKHLRESRRIREEVSGIEKPDLGMDTFLDDTCPFGSGIDRLPGIIIAEVAKDGFDKQSPPPPYVPGDVPPTAKGTTVESFWYPRNLSVQQYEGWQKSVDYADLYYKPIDTPGVYWADIKKVIETEQFIHTPVNIKVTGKYEPTVQKSLVCNDDGTPYTPPEVPLPPPVAPAFVVTQRPSLLKRILFKQKDAKVATNLLVNHEMDTMIKHKNDKETIVGALIGKKIQERIPDNLIWEELFIYLRVQSFPAYPDRKSKLEHMDKLAKKYLAINDIDLTSNDIHMVNRFKITIQKATDQNDDDFFLAKQTQQTSLRQRFGRAWFPKGATQTEQTGTGSFPLKPSTTTVQKQTVSCAKGNCSHNQCHL